MIFYYRFSEESKVKEKYGIGAKQGRYWTLEEIKEIPLYKETKEIEREFLEENSSDLWIIHDEDGYSWELVECETEEEAYIYLFHSNNQSIYEYIHDL